MTNDERDDRIAGNKVSDDVEAGVKKAKKKAIDQHKYFCGIVDFDFDEPSKDHSAGRFLRALEIGFDCQVDVWAILHDCDCYAVDIPKMGNDNKEVFSIDGKQVFLHKKGERKIDHIHFVVKVDRKKTKDGFIDKMQDALTLAGYAPIEIGKEQKKFKRELITASPCTSFKQSVRYLIHEDENPFSSSGVILRMDKMPYDESQIATNSNTALTLALNNISDGKIDSDQLELALTKTQTITGLVKEIGLNNVNRYLRTIQAMIKEKNESKYIHELTPSNEKLAEYLKNQKKS